jgi:hypothetical protein
MSLNHIIKTNGVDENQLISIACKDFTPIGDLTITCDDNTTFNIKPPTLGTAGQVLKSDGLGNTYFGNDTAGSSGVNYQGTVPVAVGSHSKISNTLGTEVVESKLIETATELNLTNLNITGAGNYNSTIINNGTIEATSTNLNLTPSVGNQINLNGLTSAQDHKIVNCLDPTLAQDVATKNYVDGLIGGGGSGISYSGAQPTVIGELLKFNSTDGSSVDKSKLVESATDLNLGSLNIINVGNVDNVDVSAFKTSYDSNVNQDVKTTANPTFQSITTDQILGTTPLTGTSINTFLLNNSYLYGGQTAGAHLHLVSNTTSTKGQVIISDEVNLLTNKIINVGAPTTDADATNKLYVDTKFSSVPTQVYDLIIPLTSETGAVNSTGTKAVFHMPRTMTITGLKASLRTNQTSGTQIEIKVTKNGFDIISTASALTIQNGTAFSNSPALQTTAITSNDRIVISIDSFGDGTAEGLKLTILGTA